MDGRQRVDRTFVVTKMEIAFWTSTAETRCVCQCRQVMPIASTNAHLVCCLLQVTFTVDMSVVSSVSEQGVHIAGTFQGWDAESTMLQTTETALGAQPLEVSPGAHEFKFINGAGWNGGEENMNGTSCNAGGNRGAEFDAENNTYEACFNICPGESCLPRSRSCQPHLPSGCE